MTRVNAMDFYESLLEQTLVENGKQLGNYNIKKIIEEYHRFKDCAIEILELKNANEKHLVSNAKELFEQMIHMNKVYIAQGGNQNLFIVREAAIMFWIGNTLRNSPDTSSDFIHFWEKSLEQIMTLPDDNSHGFV